MTEQDLRDMVAKYDAELARDGRGGQGFSGGAEVTIKDADGREWVLVPKDGDWNMTKAALALITSSNINTGDLTIGTLAAAFENAIAAAPQFVPPAVTDDVAIDLARCVFSRLNDGLVCPDDGRKMITAVQQVLGPTLGLAPIREAAIDSARGAK